MGTKFELALRIVFLDEGLDVMCGGCGVPFLCMNPFCGIGGDAEAPGALICENDPWC